MKIFIVGSSYFFKGMRGFKSKDVDRVALTDSPVGFKDFRQTSGSGFCLFEWRRMSPEEFVEKTLSSNLPMEVGKFLVKEFCEEIGFTLEHLRKLKPQFDKLDPLHDYERAIYDSIIANGLWKLTDEQLQKAYGEYLKEREQGD